MLLLTTTLFAYVSPISFWGRALLDYARWLIKTTIIKE
jgi:hypothetical protein